MGSQITRKTVVIGMCLMALVGVPGRAPGGGLTTIASFNESDGSLPEASVTLDAQGDIYGTTQYGGANGGGTVGMIAKGSNTITTLAYFTGANGKYPQANLSLDSQGNIYGTTSFGGTYGYGTLFEVADPTLYGTNTITVLASFNGYSSPPFSVAGTYRGATLDAQGNLYGTTVRGGTYNDGTVWGVAGSAVPEPSSLFLLAVGGWDSWLTPGSARARQYQG